MNTPQPLVLVVAVALVDPDGRVLIAQRPEGKSMAGLWEFPGGKIETGERPETALIRGAGVSELSSSGSECPSGLKLRATRAGTPTTSVLSGTSRVTTEPAATIAPTASGPAASRCETVGLAGN